MRYLRNASTAKVRRKMPAKTPIAIPALIPVLRSVTRCGLGFGAGELAVGDDDLVILMFAVLLVTVVVPATDEVIEPMPVV